MNKITAIGFLGADPEMRYTPQGSPVTEFRLASSRQYTTKDGEKRKETVWLRVSCWMKLAENVNQYCKKGSQVYIEGELIGDSEGNPRMWDSKDGTKKCSFEVRASEVQFLDRKPDNGKAAPKAEETETY